MRYIGMIILSFKDADTRKLAHGDLVRRFVNLESVARRKLRQIEIANVLEDLRIPSGNHLEQLKGDRNGKTVSGLMISFASVFIGLLQGRNMSKLSIITRGPLLWSN